MPSPTTEATISAALRQDPEIESAIATIVRRLDDAQQSITGTRPSEPGAEATCRDWLDRLTATKGRPPVYPYIGSGVGSGPLVELVDGSVKWDMIIGIGVHLFGHSDPDLVATALRAAMGDTVMQGNLQCNADAVRFAELLIAEAARTSEVARCFVTNSGAMANESALKICFQKAGGAAPRILAFADCFTGRSVTLAQITDNPANRVGVPLNTPVDYVPFYDPAEGAASIEAAVSRLRVCLDRYPGQHACFVMEPVQGEGGFNVAPPEYFRPLMELCRERGVANWMDEVQTFGRTHEMYHFEQLGVGDLVDVVTIGKMSQVCACLYTEDFNPKPGLLSGTFIGSTVGLQVGHRMLERLRDGGYYGAEGRIARLHEAYRREAEALIGRRPEWFGPIEGCPSMPLCGGVGGMMRLTPFGGVKERVIKSLHAMFDEGVIAFYCGHGPYHVRFLAPVGVMEPDQFTDVFEVVERGLARAAGG